MRLGLPKTLLLHVLFEQLRVVALTAGVIVVVIAFAAAIKPIGDGDLDPLDAPKFMLLAMVPMLAYALPFAGGFGTTLAYHRLTQDHETVAARASGISNRMLMAPALACGLLLAGSLMALNEQVIPRFLRSMQEFITRDVARLIVRNVAQGDSFQLNNVMLHADMAQSLGPEGSAYERILLRGVVLCELEPRSGEDAPLAIASELSTSEAVVWLYHASSVERVSGETEQPREGTVAVIRLLESVVRQKGDRALVHVQDTLDVGPMFLPGAFANDPKFLTYGELRRVNDEPERMEFVQWRKRRLASRLGRLETIEFVDEELRERGRMRLVDPLDRTLYLEGAGLTPVDSEFRVVRPADSPIEVTIIRDASSASGVTRWSVGQAFVRIDEKDRVTQPLEMVLRLRDARSEAEASEAAQGRREEIVLGGLRMDTDQADELLRLPVSELISRAHRRTAAAPEPELDRRQEDLAKSVDSLRREVLSKIHERMAMAVACAVMVLTGAVTAMRLGRASPLVVYLVSFFPALCAIIAINGGQHLVHRIGEPGLPLLWGGNAVLLLYTLFAYRGVARH
ncbi:MAG: LptF/LptG family permease [Phycisphaeraceae bacterium]|nr:LptF/LptG family permease [Phycisphaeraceae bacterium]